MLADFYCIFHKKNQETLFNLNDVMYSGTDVMMSLWGDLNLIDKLQVACDYI